MAKTRYSVGTQKCMQKNLPFIAVLALVAVFGLIQSAITRFSQPGAPTIQTEVVSSLLGSLESMNAETRESVVILLDGGVENVLLPANQPKIEIGSLLQIDGVRELSTRRITAETVAVQNDRNLVVTSPTEGSTVTSPLVVFGFGRVFEQTFNWRIKDESGEVVKQGIAMTSAPDMGQFGPFRFEVFLPALISTNFTLEVFDYSMKDGSIQDLVSLQLKSLSSRTMSVDVFFPNAKNGSTDDCSKVFPITRVISQTSAVGRAALLELLTGPTAEERKQGFFTSIPADVGLKSLVISDGVATPDFDAWMNNVGGSCRVSSIRAQIEHTLRQFSSVAEVIIKVDGNSKEALQP